MQQAHCLPGQEQLTLPAPVQSKTHRKGSDFMWTWSSTTVTVHYSPLYVIFHKTPEQGVFYLFFFSTCTISHANSIRIEENTELQSQTPGPRSLITTNKWQSTSVQSKPFIDFTSQREFAFCCSVQSKCTYHLLVVYILPDV